MYSFKICGEMFIGDWRDRVVFNKDDKWLPGSVLFRGILRLSSGSR